MVLDHLVSAHDAIRLKFGQNFQSVSKTITRKWHNEESNFRQKPIIVANLVAGDPREVDVFLNMIERIQDGECLGDDGD